MKIPKGGLYRGFIHLTSTVRKPLSATCCDGHSGALPLWKAWIILQ
ncbi:hypothetical protein [Chitinophaga costaii]|nr:hypothetical protein [Chitinophaga costaii]